MMCYILWYGSDMVNQSKQQAKLLDPNYPDQYIIQPDPEEPFFFFLAGTQLTNADRRLSLPDSDRFDFFFPHTWVTWCTVEIDNQLSLYGTRSTLRSSQVDSTTMITCFTYVVPSGEIPASSKGVGAGVGVYRVESFYPNGL